MRLPRLRTLRPIAITLALLSCTENGPTGPRLDVNGARLITGESAPSTVVISQVYGGGGNAGAQYKNDFIEIFNRSGSPVSLAGWSVQYASATGNSWQKTDLSGTIQPGKYILIQEAVGAGTTLPALPTPEFAGTIPMSATAGKVALVRNNTPLTCATCTVSASVIADFVGFGPTASDFEGAATPTLSNSTAAIRATAGCADTDSNNADFSVAAPAPRNGSVAAITCATQPPPPAGAVASVRILSPAAPATVSPNGTQQYTAAAFDAGGNDVTSANPITWSVAPSSLATISTTGLVTATAVGDVTVTASSGGKTAQTTLHIIAPPSSVPSVHFSEIHYDNLDTDFNERIEIEGPAGTNLSGWSVVLYNGTGGVPYATTNLGVAITQGQNCGANGVIVVNYDPGASGAVQNGPDGFALLNGTQVVEFLSYEGSFTATSGPAAGLVSANIGVAEASSPVGQSLQRKVDGSWEGPKSNTFGVCNASGATVPPAPNAITFGFRVATDPALPVGFEDQLNVTLHDGSTGATSFPQVAWKSETESIATIDQDGVIRGVAPGNAVFRATVADGTTATYSLPVTTNIFSTTADWSGNLEFGVPTDQNASDDHIITHSQFTSSYSYERNTPNWISAKLEASHYAPAGSPTQRCDCFTFDPQVPANLYYTSNAYFGVGSTWNRGHLLRSADVQSAPGDNAMVFYFSNIAPQSAQMNQGPWAQQENFLGDLAKTGGKDVYEVVGVAGSQGTLKNEGKVTIPLSFWKVAVVVPHGKRLADIHSYVDVQVIAVIMPNVANVNADWTTYKTTTDAVEALSGYDLLNALPDEIELLVEANDRPPTAVMAGPGVGVEGSALSFSGNGSSDPDAGDVLTYTWDFDDHTTATGINPSHTFADNGTYIVTLTVTDKAGAMNRTSSTVTVSNVTPSGTFSSPPSVSEGSSFRLSIDNVIDPGSADVAAGFSYRFDCGNGFGGWTSSSSVSCIAGDNPGTSVAAKVQDKDGATASYTGSVVINNVAPTAVFSNNGPVNEGSSFTLRIDGVTDVAADIAAGFQYRFDCGTGPGAWQSAPTASCAADNHGTYNVRGEVQDKDGDESIYSSTVTVNNVAPTAVFLYSGSANEGSPFTLAINNAHDSPADFAAGFEYRFDCGTGPGNWGTATSVSCPTTDNGTPNVSGEIRDHDHAVSMYNGTVNVNNVAPVVVVDAAAPITSGTTFTLSTGFADAGQNDAPWTYVINWGNGTTNGTSTAQVPIPASHQYLVTGTYTITVTVTDKDGGVGSKSITLQVNPVSGTLDVLPSRINTTNNGNGIVKVTVLGNSSFSGSSIVLSTVRIGNVHPAMEGNGAYKIQIADVNHDGIADMVVQFTRSELAADGDLNGSQLTLNATLTDGRQIQSTGPISVK